jgi:3-oxoacyl-[acyl-carrier-protein] synthase-3
MIESGTIERALLLIGDVDIESEKKANISFSMMFGDAGAACIVERGVGRINGMIRSDGSGYRTIITPRPGARFPEKTDEPMTKKMNGEDTFLFTITKVPKLFKEFFTEFSCDKDEFDYYILHQANSMIIQQIAKKLKVHVDKFPISLDKYGNTDGASIPVTIVDLCQKIKKSQKLKLIVSGFGVGLSWGIVSFEIDSNSVLPIIETDEYYIEGRTI